MWALFLLAQHYDKRGQYDLSLFKIDEAIGHTPTLIDLYSAKIVDQVEVEYVFEKAELEDGMDEEFRKIFEKFSFQDSAGAKEDKKDESDENTTANRRLTQTQTQKRRNNMTNKKRKACQIRKKASTEDEDCLTETDLLQA